MLKFFRSLFVQPASAPVVESPQHSVTAAAYDSTNTVDHRTTPSGVLQDGWREMTPGQRVEMERRSISVVRNSGYARALVGDVELYSVGDRIRIQSQAPNPDWRKRAEAIFFDWCERCEVTQRFSFDEVLTMVCRAVDISGGIFPYKVQTDLGPMLQLIPSHRIGNGVSGNDRIRDGIGVDDYGAPIFYRVLLDSGKHVDVPARDMLHVFEPEDITLVRNPPTIQHSLNDIIDEREIMHLEKGAAKMNADLVYNIQREGGELPEDSDFSVTNRTALSEGTDPGELQRITGMKFIATKPGEEIKPYQSNRPSQAFNGFVNLLRRNAAGGILPPEFTDDPSAIGGAVVRLVVTKADRQFQRRQRLLFQRFIKPVWFFVIGSAIDRGEIEAIPGWWKVSYVPPRRITVDAGREQREHRENVKAGLTSIRDHFEESGGEATEELEANALMAKFIKELAAKYDVPEQMIYAAWPEPPPEAVAPEELPKPKEKKQ